MLQRQKYNNCGGMLQYIREGWRGERIREEEVKRGRREEGEE